MINSQKTRKQCVYEMLQTDMKRQEIANSLYVSLSTVKRTIAEIYTEMGVSSRKEFRTKTQIK